MTVDIKFWNKFYKKSLTNKPSNFAKLLLKKNKIKKPLLIDFGCGNARDTFYFLSKNFSCFGIDTSREIISLKLLRISSFCDLINVKLHKLCFCKSE